VHDIKGQVRPQVEAAPDRRLGVIEVDPDRVNRDLVEWRATPFGSRLAPSDLCADQGQVASELAQVGQFQARYCGLERAEQLGLRIVVS
jgi:hypothetical protein